MSFFKSWQSTKIKCADRTEWSGMSLNMNHEWVIPFWCHPFWRRNVNSEQKNFLHVKTSGFKVTRNDSFFLGSFSFWLISPQKACPKTIVRAIDVGFFVFFFSKWEGTLWALLWSAVIHPLRFGPFSFHCRIMNTGTVAKYNWSLFDVPLASFMTSLVGCHIARWRDCVGQTVLRSFMTIFSTCRHWLLLWVTGAPKPYKCLFFS